MNDVTPGTHPLKKILVGLFAFGVSGIIISSALTVGVWPGELKLTAPLFCTDAQPEPFIVSDTYTEGGETITNFTMYCMGPRGDATDVGFGRPFFVVTLAHSTILWLLVLFSSGLGGRGHLRRSRGGPADVEAVQDAIVPDIIADR